MNTKATGRHGIGSPANRRVEFNGSGAPSGMMAQPHRHRGPIGSGRAPLDPDLAREKDVRSGLWPKPGWRRPKCRLRRSVRPAERDEGTREAGSLLGRRLWCYLPKRAGLSKSLAPARRAGETSRAKPSRPAWRSHANQEREGRGVSPPADHNKTAAQGCGFIGSTGWREQGHRP